MCFCLSSCVVCSLRLGKYLQMKYSFSQQAFLMCCLDVPQIEDKIFLFMGAILKQRNGGTDKVLSDFPSRIPAGRCLAKYSLCIGLCPGDIRWFLLLESMAQMDNKTFQRSLVRLGKDTRWKLNKHAENPAWERQLRTGLGVENISNAGLRLPFPAGKLGLLYVSLYFNRWV